MGVIASRFWNSKGNLHSSWESFIMKKISLVSILILCGSMAFAQDAMWNDDKSSNAFNCDGFVTDAICCQDDLCNGQDENSCTSDGKKKIFSASGINSYGGYGGGYGQPSYGGYGYDKPSYGSHGGYDEHDHKYDSSDDYDNKPKYDDGHGYKEESYGYKPKYDDGHGYKEESYGYKPKYDEYKPEPYGYKPMYEEYGYKRPSYGGYHNYGYRPYGYRPKYEKRHGYKPKYDDYKPKYENKPMDDHVPEENNPDGWEE